MGKINILEPNVFNMISAGEVVERPASVVKELVENSIDAGATEVDIYIEEGGIRRIQVSDNGIGILKEDMRSAFLPHATSKLKQITDLDSLSTLGFRGEALASISSVSEVSLVSYSKQQGSSSKIVLSGGKVIEEGPASRTEGTLITVDNLFFNTPARLKFLKKPISEQHCVQDIVKMLILGNPSVKITLSNESGDLLSSEGGELVDALYSIYGAKTADNLLEIVPNENAIIKVSGFTSKVDFSKPNRTYQTIIVNGRAVEDVTIQTAAERAYQDFLMKRTYPMFVLDILMPFEDVDANVHPSKTEVRFRDKQAVFSAVYHTVLDTINNSLGQNTVAFGSILQNDEKETVRMPEKQEQMRLDTQSMFNFKSTPSGLNFAMSTDKPASILHENFSNISFDKINLNDDFNPFVDDNDNVDKFEHDLIDNQIVNQDQSAVFDGKIVGQIFDTYIICERDEHLYIIDQHAAHERILYDRLISKFDVNFKQPLLIPYKLVLSGEESTYFDKILPNLINLGFDIEQTNDANYLISAVPEPVSNVNFSKFFADLFSNMGSEQDLTLENLLKDKLCQQACKAAIKGGDALTRAQIEMVIKNYMDKDGNLPSKCPHGRPAVVVFSIKDIEKLFKRIV